MKIMYKSFKSMKELVIFANKKNLSKQEIEQIFHDGKEYIIVYNDI